jgi:UDP-3-O-acyl N-acetylglucosamine deacetylase
MIISDKQKTIKKEISFTGKALQTGCDVSILCKPQEADKGITFKRIDLAGKPVVELKEAIFSSNHQRRSTIGVGVMEIQTVEHFLAALWALEIDNILIELNEKELPAMDGSSLVFYETLKSAGIQEQSADRRYIKVEEPERIEKGTSSIEVLPSDTFKVSYEIDYNVASINKEIFAIEPDRENFEQELAPARTFCLKEEAEALLKMGLGKGANYDNTLVLEDEGPIGTEFRFSNEPVRHKVLDLIGDFYILGRPIIGQVVAKKSGHALNGAMIKRLYEKYG